MTISPPYDISIMTFVPALMPLLRNSSGTAVLIHINFYPRRSPAPACTSKYDAHKAYAQNRESELYSCSRTPVSRLSVMA